MKPGRLHTTLVAMTMIIASVVIGCGGAPSFNNMTKDELFAYGKERLDRKKHLSAINAFQTLVYTYPGESIVDTAQYYLALSYFGNHDYDLAAAEFNRLVVNYPTSPFAKQSQFMKAVSAFESTPKHFGLDQTEVELAIKQLEEFIIDNPESELVPDANKYLAAAQGRLAKKYYMSGVTYTRMGASKAAKVYYQKVIDDYTSSEFAPLANYEMAREEMRLREYDEARRRFENFVTVFPTHSLVPEAREQIAEAAFKSAELAFDKKNYSVANDKFTAFKNEFPNDKRLKKADEYLAKIAAVPAPPAPQANAQSK